MREDLTRAILQRIGADPCASAQARLCAYVDEELTGFQKALVQEHLEHCPFCAQLAEALKAASQDLPSLAALDPGPEFTERTLARTSRAPQRLVPSAWQRLLRRPRIALETAWLGTAAGVVILAPFPKGTPAALVSQLGESLEARAIRLRPSLPLHAAKERTASTHLAVRGTATWFTRLRYGTAALGQRVARWFQTAFRWVNFPGNPPLLPRVTPTDNSIPEPSRSPR